ncbi:glycosyltransferase [Aureibacter tunicatorum]|uniref:Glycosyltransferase involved in cell wall biosynthesis n=1 Tax=Aureibacter tunicatorum TaxID=866807 RepID=A0AAE4BVB4_9BACT|nr:glycosyltransferase [Aureibacter tunicatorum]MDR6241900.1 glycosyltransferase involved in cell wall biosynthesis [Aureibacter tunicatorum]BDD07449.1 glycosyl transferase [Aureibacter tunicatorum]
MHILFVDDATIPVSKYGAVERFIWWLGEELNRRGHQISYLVGKGSYCPFAQVIEYNPLTPLSQQIPDYVDIVHFNFPINQPFDKKPHLTTIHGNYPTFQPLGTNSVFVSKNHAARHNSESFVHIGINTDDYGVVNWSSRRENLLFLAKASLKVKNLISAITISKMVGEQLTVAGGWGESNDNVNYKGMIGGIEKNQVINSSKALLFPVIWHEPFGIAMIEALYFGCPVFGTPYGSLPELIIPEVGFLSNNASELIEALHHIDDYNRKKCHEYVCDNFNHFKMTDDYLKLYEKVLNGHSLNNINPANYPSDSFELPLYG